MIVIDASVAVLGLLGNGQAHRTLVSDRAVTPHLADSEIAQALRAQVRRGHITGAQGRATLDSWSQLGVRRMATFRFFERIWELRHNLTAYDATYVALAEALGCELLTADARIAAAPGPNCPITVIRR